MISSNSSSSSSSRNGRGVEESKGWTTDVGDDESERKPRPMSSLVSLEFEKETLEMLGHVENVSTHYRDLLRGTGREEEARLYARFQAQSGEVVSIETAAMKRSRDFLLILAEEMAKKRGRRIFRRAFVGWRVHVFRYIFLRDQIVVNYIVNTFLARRFHAWRLVARRNVVLGSVIRQCWRRRRCHRFRYWKYGARWQTMKWRLRLRVFRTLKENAKFQIAVRRRWKAMGAFLKRRWAITLIQRVYRWHALRLVFWAKLTLKRFFMRRNGLKVLKQRRKEELRRSNYEQETTDILVRRALENLDGLLNDEGVILSQYLKSVNGVAKQIESAQPGTQLANEKLFPSLKDAPDFARAWTVRAKAMAVLRMRCTAEVVRLARRRFRQSSPALYECTRCAKTFLLRAEKFQHQKYGGCPLQLNLRLEDEDAGDDDEDDEEGGGNYRQKKQEGKRRGYAQRLKSRRKGYGVPEDNEDELERDYLCWKLAHPIVEAALQPLASYLTKQKPHPGGASYVIPKKRGGGIL